MTISVGDKLPDAAFNVMTPDGPDQISSGELFDGKTVVLFAVPGAFTPTCHAKHLPGFIALADELKAKGVDTIACVSVNDPFVMGAWAEQTGGKGKITFLADGNVTFTKAIGMELDASGGGLGMRSKRYSMLVIDGVVEVLNEGDGPGEFEIASAERMLEAL